MWRLCCGVGRKESKTIEIQRHPKATAGFLRAVSTEPDFSLAGLRCDDCTKSSRSKSNGHTFDNLTQRHSTPYFEVDLETGRRPTLVDEATARLAVAESVDLTQSRRNSCIHPSAVYSPLGEMSNRRKATPENNVDPFRVASCSLKTELSFEGASTGRRKSSFTALRSSGSASSFRKRMLLKKSDRRGFPKLTFMSRNRPEDCDINADSPMQITSPNSPIMTPSSPRSSLCIFSHADEPIVTPFAQILASLRKVRANFIGLTNVHSSRDLRFGTSQTEESPQIPFTIGEDPRNSLAVETLEELEWCLERLEGIQTHRSVSDMASSKFKKMLNKELSQVYDGDKINSQISEYICSTFLDQNEQSGDCQLPGGSRGEAGDHGEEEEGEEEEEEGYGDDNDLLLFAKVAAAAAAAATSMSVNAVAGSSNDGAIQQTVPVTSDDISQNSDQQAGLVQFDRSSPQKLTTTAVTPEKPSGEMFLDASRANDSHLSSVASICVPNIMGASSSMTGIGVDPQKVCQFADPPEPPPLYGIIPEHSNEMAQLMENDLDRWGMDIFKLAEYTSNPLTCVTYTILKQRRLISKFKIPHWNLLRYLLSVESHYNTYTPYHNKIHAADVVQSIHVLLQAPVLDSVFTDLELTAVIIACAIHDVNHPGVTNQYLINTNDALAILYNDSSVLENYHLAVAFNLFTFPGCDILVNLTRKQRLTFRRMVIDMVLSTDMSKHMSLLADLKTMVETMKVAGSGVLSLENCTDRMQILQNMVHCADLSNTAKPLELYTKWMYRLMDEFFLQGDRERAAGLDISPMCDRETATIEKSQVSFIDFISHPLWEAWSDLVHPAAQDILELLEFNRSWYFNLIHADDHHHHNHHYHHQQQQQSAQSAPEAEESTCAAATPVK